MATYKVIQDIEAEDKLLGPLTLKQFLFMGIALFTAYLQFLLITKGAAFLIVFLLPFTLVFGFLAWPFGRDQPTEIWVLAKIRFMFKPRKRIWDQTGLKELVTITAPAQADHALTDGLSQGEVKSRLQALASTIDSRGWAIKNVSVNAPGSQSTLVTSSDRLISLNNFPQEVASNDVRLSDDILDEQNNPRAQNLDRMISATTSARKEQLAASMRQGSQQPAAQTDYWFLSQPSGQIPAGQAVFDGATTVRPTEQPVASNPTSTDLAAQQKLASAQQQAGVAYGNMRTIQPLPATPPAPVSTAPTEPVMPSSKTPDPAILELANNDDLDVATIARQANKKKSGELGDDEVVVSLH